MVETLHNHSAPIHSFIEYISITLGTICPSGSILGCRKACLQSIIYFELTSLLSIPPISPLLSFLCLPTFHIYHHQLPDEEVKIHSHSESKKVKSHLAIHLTGIQIQAAAKITGNSISPKNTLRLEHVITAPSLSQLLLFYSLRSFVL